MKKYKMPKEVFIYVCDELEDGTPVLAAATGVDQIPEDVSGQRIGVYSLKTSPVFVVYRKLS